MNLLNKSSSQGEVRTNQSTPHLSILTTRINGIKSSECRGNEEALSIEAMSRCARFDFCSAPKCPLDILINLRTEIDEDPRCEMAKATRHKYWESMPDYLNTELKFEGYFEVEYNRMKSARARFDALPEEKKREIRERMRNVHKSVRA